MENATNNHVTSTREEFQIVHKSKKCVAFARLSLLNGNDNNTKIGRINQNIWDTPGFMETQPYLLHTKE